MATAKATGAYFRRIGAAAVHPDNVRKLGALKVSSIGFGAYRVEDGNSSHAEAMMMVGQPTYPLLSLRVTTLEFLITRIEFRGSERMIGDVLRELEKEGISREEIVVSTKVGYIEGNDLEMARSAPPPE
eukprot:jgi/Bigna1/144328/aug1.86_g19036